MSNAVGYISVYTPPTRTCCVCEKTTEVGIGSRDLVQVMCFDCDWAGQVWAAKQAHAERQRRERDVRRSARRRELMAAMGIKIGDTVSSEKINEVDAQIAREEKDAAVFDSTLAALTQTAGSARPASSQQVFVGVGQLRCTAYKKINERGYCVQCDCPRGHGGSHSTVSGRSWVSGDSDTGDMSWLNGNVNVYTPPPPVSQRLKEAREELGLPPLPTQEQVVVDLWPAPAVVLSTVDRLPDELMRMRTADAPPPEPAKEEPPAEPETEGDELLRFFKGDDR